MNKMLRKNRGITLVALVITIIVLLILAGISLSMVFNENGLIAKAKEAANETEYAKINELSDLDKLTGQIDSYQVPVPDGFYYVGGTVETGFVISSVENDDLANSKQGNQFVWVPVASAADWKQNFTYKSNYGVTAENTKDGALPEGIKAETIAQKGGFYIARYEAGKPTGTETAPVSKKGATVWTSISQPDCLTSSAAMYNSSNSNSVVSGLITGAGWDVTMNFIANHGDKKDVTDSSTWGNYNNSIEPANITGAGSLQTKTGFSEYWQANHIYDLGGNAWEYINEKNTTTNPCVKRGGYYNNSGADFPASYRNNGTGVAYSGFTFRVALYIK